MRVLPRINLSRLKTVKPQFLFVVLTLFLLPLSLLLVSRPTFFKPKASVEKIKQLVFSSPVRVNKETAKYQNHGAVATSSSGIVHTVWRDSHAYDNNESGDVYYAKSDDGGGGWSDGKKLNKDEINWGTETPAPSVAVDGDTVMVVWSDGGGLFSTVSKDGGDSWSEPKQLKQALPTYSTLSLNSYYTFSCGSNCAKIDLYINQEKVDIGSKDVVINSTGRGTGADVTFSGVSYQSTDAIDFYINWAPYEYNGQNRPWVEYATIGGVQTTAGIVDLGLMSDGTAVDCQKLTPLTGKAINVPSEGRVAFNHNCEGQVGYKTGESVLPRVISAWSPKVIFREGGFYVAALEQLESSNRVVLYSTKSAGESWDFETVQTDLKNDTEDSQVNLAASSKLHVVFDGEDGNWVGYRERPLSGGDWSGLGSIKGSGQVSHPDVTVGGESVLVAFTADDSRTVYRAVKPIDSTSFLVGKISREPTPVSGVSTVGSSDNLRIYWSGLDPSGSGSDSRVLFYSESRDQGVSFSDPKKIYEDSEAVQRDPDVYREKETDHVVYRSPSSSQDDVYYLSGVVMEINPPQENYIIVTAKADYSTSAPYFAVRIKEMDEKRSDGSDPMREAWYVGTLARNGGTPILTKVDNKDDFQDYRLPLDREVINGDEVDIILLNGTEQNKLLVREFQIVGPAAWGSTAASGVYDRGNLSDENIGDGVDNWEDIKSTFDCVDVIKGQELLNQDGALRFHSSCEATPQPITFTLSAYATNRIVPLDLFRLKDGKVLDGVKDTEGKTVSFKVEVDVAPKDYQAKLAEPIAEGEELALFTGEMVAGNEFNFNEARYSGESDWKIGKTESDKVLIDYGELGEETTALDCKDTQLVSQPMIKNGAVRFNSACEDPGGTEPVPFRGAIQVKAKGRANSGGVLPKIKVAVNGVFLKDATGVDLERDVALGSYKTYIFPTPVWPKSTDKIDILFANSDLNLGETGEDSILLWIDEVYLDILPRGTSIQPEGGIGPNGKPILQDTWGTAEKEFESVRGPQAYLKMADLVCTPTHPLSIAPTCEGNAILVWDTGAIRINYPSRNACQAYPDDPSNGVCLFKFNEEGEDACSDLGNECKPGGIFPSRHCEGNACLEGAPQAGQKSCLVADDCQMTVIKPDLVATGIEIYRSDFYLTHSPANALKDSDLKVGDKVYLRANIKNEGLFGTGESFLTRWQMPAGADTSSHPALGAGEQSTRFAALISPPWTVTAGDTTISFKADAGDKITETNETNNVVSRTIKVNAGEPNNTCNKPNGLCVRAKAHLNRFALQGGPAIFRIWVDGQQLRQTGGVRHEVQQEVSNENDWKVYEFDVPGIKPTSSVYVTYINDRYDGSEENDRNLIVDWVEIAGKRLVAEEAVYDTGRFVGDYRVWRGNHDQAVGASCDKVMNGQKTMNVEGSLRFNDGTCLTKVRLGTIRGRIYKNPVITNGQMVSNGVEVTSKDSNITLRLDNDQVSPLAHSYTSPYFNNNIWQGKHYLSMKVPTNWDVRYRVCVNDWKCHEVANPAYNGSLRSGSWVNVEIPSTSPSTGEKDSSGNPIPPYVDVYWYVTPH